MDAPTVQALTTVAGASLVTFVIVEVIKRAWQPSADIASRFLPLLSVTVGVVVTLIASFALNLVQGVDLVQALITGLFAGLSASGLYDTISGGTDAIKAASSNQ